MLGTYLLGGLVNAATLVVVAFLLSRFAGEIYGRALLAIILFVAGGAYVGFAVAAGAGGLWFPAEMLQAVALGVFGLLGLRGSPYWLAAGWALHPLWDFVLHYVGPGGELAPESWAIACVSFDLLVAAYVGVTTLRRGGSAEGVACHARSGSNTTASASDAAVVRDVFGGASSG